MYDVICHDLSRLRKLSEEALVMRGVNPKDAKTIVDSMLAADIVGVSTHGIKMLPHYLNKIERGDFSLKPCETLFRSNSITLLDANNGIGAVSAMCAAKIATDDSHVFGAHTVLVRNANTFGPAFYYAETIATAGCIGFICSNSPAAMAPPNGTTPMLGTNPLAFACPTSTHGCLVFDMATSVVSKSRIGEAKARGVSLEHGWALDSFGQPTTDPSLALSGTVLPMAGYKGIALAMMIDIVAGVLSGAGFLNTVGKFYSQNATGMNVGQMVVAFDPSVVYGTGFAETMDHYVDMLRASRPVEGLHIVLPGDDRLESAQRTEQAGIRLSGETGRQLEEILGVTLFETRNG